MANRADILATLSGGLLQFSGAGTNYLIVTPTGVLYLVYVDGSSDVSYRKSSDFGFTWTTATNVFVGTVVALSVWYDRWSNISAGLIHMAYTESVGSDVLYRSLDSEAADALSTETTIFNGASSAGGGTLSITRTRGGNLLCIFDIDAGTEHGFSRSTDVGATWSPMTEPSSPAFATTDQCIMLPGFAADNQDAMLFFWDASGNEIFRELYDDSANTWGSTSIAASMADTVASTSFPHFAAAVDLTNSQNLLVAWSAVDTANADLRCFKITESAITEVTNVVLNSVDDQAQCAIGIDTVSGYWYVFYGGKSDGSETVGTLINVYYKVSTDSGTTWGAETLLSTSSYNIKWIACPPRFASRFYCAYHCSATGNDIKVSVNLRTPTARSQVGL